jgi:hypothetical protein
VVEPLLPGIYGGTCHQGKNAGLIVEEYNPNDGKNIMEI